MLNINKENLKDYHEYISKYEEIKELATTFKITPGEIVDSFFKIGLEALKSTEFILRNEFESKLKEIFPDVEGSNIKKGLSIILDAVNKK